MNKILIEGPYRQQANRLERISNVIGLMAIGTLLAVSFVGMTGALDDDKQIQLACIDCAGGVR